MLETLLASNVLSLAVRTPGKIVGPVAKLLGVLYNGVFNFIYGINEAHALGIAIILVTILVKTILLPLIYKQQKSTFAMQKLQPEMDKIKKKYEKKKDAESQQKMALELQKLQKDNNVSMFGGCLPLLIQLPILYALFYIFQQAYMYIDIVGIHYGEMADLLMIIPLELRDALLQGPIVAHKLALDTEVRADMIVLVNQLTVADWGTIVASAGEFAAPLTDLLEKKYMLENFLGINLIQNAGFKIPSIAIPLMAGGTTYLSSKVMMAKTNKSKAGASGEGGMMEQSMQMMKTMNYIMPVMMGFMCISMPAGVGLYWTISNLIQALQTVGFNKYFSKKKEKEALQS